MGLVSTRTVRLGAGAGFAGDRIDPAEDLAHRGELDYLVFEALGERTVAAGHARRLADPDAGYDPMWGARLRAVLPHTLPGGTRIITNSGAANPEAAGRVAIRTARELGQRCRVAVVTGDSVLDQVQKHDPVLWGTGERVSQASGELISANAYLGAEPIIAALDGGADVVITGRVADPALFLGPLIHEFGWSHEDWATLGRGTAVGHLLECAGQLTGGYYADPVTKPVPGLARLGFPFADVSEDGTAVFGKLPGTGGILTPRTCAEQLLYEVSDPSAYITPDVIADFSGVRLLPVGPDQVQLERATGAPRPEELKVTLGFLDGWLGEGEISYAGPRALERAQLAGDVVRERLVAVHGLVESAVDVEYIGAGESFRGMVDPGQPVEVRLRVAGTVPTEQQANAIGWEVEALYTNGPAGGGGARKGHQQMVAVRSCLLPRPMVATSVEEVVA